MQIRERATMPGRCPLAGRTPAGRLLGLLLAGSLMVGQRPAVAADAAPGASSSPTVAATPVPTTTTLSADDQVDPSASQLGLQLAIEERGPDRPWRMLIKNTGAAPVTLAADSKLLFFDVEVPGQKQPTECILPDVLRKGGDHGVLHVTLAPGEVLTRHLDPRFYCFEEEEQSVLVPGAIVKPRYGWPNETKTSWKKGKRVVEVLPPAPPFVATPISDATPLRDTAEEHGSGQVGEALEENDPSSAAHASTVQTGGIRQLQGTAIALGPAYAVWSSVGLDDKDKAPLRLRVTRGSDSDTERGVTVTVALTNQTNAPLNLFFRRELVSFDVLGPPGTASCRVEEDFREPERQAFLRLAPGKEMSFVTRLVELCPRGTFLTPGLYLVGAKLHARYAGERFGLDAFVGEVPSVHPKPVRVRKREEPFLAPAPIHFRSTTPSPAAPPPPAGTPPPPPAPPPAPAPPAEGG